MHMLYQHQRTEPPSPSTATATTMGEAPYGVLVGSWEFC